MPDKPALPALRNHLLNEIFIALGFTAQSWPRKLLWPVFWPAAHMFAHLVAGVDQDVRQFGTAEAARRLLQKFVPGVDLRGAEQIPTEGPLIVASNHPGAYDSIALAAQLHQPDLKVIVSKIGLLPLLPDVDQLMIYTGLETPGRMAALRAMIRHLQGGGTVLIFPSGVVDPDPDVLPGASQSLGDWSPSVEIALRRVPQAKLLPCIVSSVLSPRSLQSPLLRLQQEEWRQRKLAEFIQVLQQVLFKRDYGLTPRITFGQPLNAAELLSKHPNSDLMQAVIAQARLVLEQHMAWAPNKPSGEDQAR
jgi:hypothetical protein